MNEQIETALRNVIDPELGLNVVDLGMVTHVECDQGRVAVTMILTSMSCPFWDLFVDQVKTAVVDVEGVRDVEVRYDVTQVWTPGRLSPSARDELELSGLLPAGRF